MAALVQPLLFAHHRREGGRPSPSRQASHRSSRLSESGLCGGKRYTQGEVDIAGPSDTSLQLESRFDKLSSSTCDRRRVALSLMILATSISKPAFAEDESTQFSLDLELYVNEMEGFSLLKPVKWNKVEKAGATVLFEDPQAKGNNLGVVVNPVRISSLRDFGTPDVVADKLLQAEKKKPSTNNVQLIDVKERQVHGGVPLYQLEYKLDSSRGAKRIFSAVTVASKKLYILNIAFVDSAEKPLLASMATTINQIVNSFDLLSQ